MLFGEIMSLGTFFSMDISPNEQIFKACELALAKLTELDLDQQLQSEINWCLASFQNDGNTNDSNRPDGRIGEHARLGHIRIG